MERTAIRMGCDSLTDEERQAIIDEACNRALDVLGRRLDNLERLACRLRSAFLPDHATWDKANREKMAKEDAALEAAVLAEGLASLPMYDPNEDD